MKALIGNNSSKEQFKNYLAHNQASTRPIFLILIGPEGIWKTSFLRSFAEENLWDHTTTDLFWMRDCSRQLWKPHSIQVEMPDKQKTIQISDTITYDNKGIREVNNRLQQSSLSWKKILLIENLQRMTNAAMNAFLKTCEEPLPNRYILATAEHESWILPTILSRAMIIRFSPLTDEEMNKYISENYPDLQWEKKDFFIKIAMWRPWTFRTIYEKISDVPEIYNTIKELLPLLQKKGNRFKKIQILKQLEEFWFLDTFRSFIVKECTENNNSKWAENRIKIKKYINSNVSQENALRYWILSSEN